jgi:hypothetical protein
MCVNYTDLSKAYQKNLFGLPRIDQVMDSRVGCNLVSFLDCYSGYDHIPLKVKDQIRTSFIIPFDAFCYNTMSFEVKTAGATYQRGIQKCLHSQHGRNAKACIDDVVVRMKVA